MREGITPVSEVDLRLVVRFLVRGQSGRDLWSLPDAFTIRKVLLQVRMRPNILQALCACVICIVTGAGKSTDCEASLSCKELEIGIETPVSLVQV